MSVLAQIYTQVGKMTTVNVGAIFMIINVAGNMQDIAVFRIAVFRIPEMLCRRSEKEIDGVGGVSLTQLSGQNPELTCSKWTVTGAIGDNIV